MNKLLSPQPIWQHNGIAIIRIVVGIFMLYHGWEVFSAEKMKVYFEWEPFKGSAWLPYVGKATEFVAGLLLALGLFTRIGALLMIGTLAYIAFFVGHGKVWYDDQHPFLFVLLGLVFVFTGPGGFALDNFIFRKK
ncbi:MAG: DoxX family protein [Chitinophagaceae bacterium]|nr:DoxX family protein [Chitinophagaceae bacterium]